MKANNLTEYLEKYGSLIAAKTAQAFVPLHVPSRDQPWHVELLRTPFGAQAHAMTAIAKAWEHEKSIMLIAEMGTGKTLMGIAAAHVHARGKPYRALVMAPDHLQKKWAREVKETIPGAHITIISKWKEAVRLQTRPPLGPEWFIIGRNAAKLGSKWKGAYWKSKCVFKWEGTKYHPGTLRCPACGAPLVKKMDEDGQVDFWTVEELDKSRRTCRDCGDALWQHMAKPLKNAPHGLATKNRTPNVGCRKWPPAQYIHKHRKGYFDYFILDEAHEEKGAKTAQGMAAGSLAASAKRVLALTGTLIGGYAHHVYPLLFRLGPQSLLAEGVEWGNSTEFTRRYGRIDTIVTEKDGGGSDNRQSRGSSKSKREAARPGVMPTLYGRHLIGNTVFLSLSEVAATLPRLIEDTVPVELPADLLASYKTVETKLVDAVKEMMKKRNTRLLSTMLQTLLSYQDYPYDWKEIGYTDRDEDGNSRWVHVVTPANYPKDRPPDPKERKLLEIVKQAKSEGHQVWVYVQCVDKRPVPERLLKMFAAEGITAEWLKSEKMGGPKLVKREDWIEKHAPGLDVVISHPQLVETGLDLFCKQGKHNFNQLVFYETGYNLFTLRQASRRAWRIGQRRNCKVMYLYYESTMQERAMELMGKKLAASLALEGQFSEEGLAAMTEDSGSIEMELAKSLSKKLEFGQAQRVWAKAGEITGGTHITQAMADKARERMRARRKLLTQDEPKMTMARVTPATVTSSEVAAARERMRARRRLFEKSA